MRLVSSKSLKTLLVASKDKPTIAKIHALAILTGIFDAWSAMIIAYSRRGAMFEALSLYHRMASEGIRPDSSTYTVVLKACTRSLDLRSGEETGAKRLIKGMGMMFLLGQRF
ncbi:hypothetical protein CK203_082611 [Vitis vinifera]|uniref:Pentatricopeptide repeat-containing protein n=1 Tax=Vitis vinifera TaxID=29760 RepID=A0A438CL65_VITVI|nr:hypothetical protein CK203_082611 [Vitis vinifera]